MRIIIVDYGMGNIASVAGAITHLGHKPVITTDPNVVAKAERIILPGVGAFPAAMQRLKDAGLLVALKEARTRAAILGLCLGAQLMGGGSTEGVATSGLNWFPGRVTKIPSRSGRRWPHVGWNTVSAAFAQESPLFAGIPSGSHFYFCHGYAFMAEQSSAFTLGWTEHDGARFDSAIGKGRVFGVQFHPEKSQQAGLRLLANFLAL